MLSFLGEGGINSNRGVYMNENVNSENTID